MRLPDRLLGLGDERTRLGAPLGRRKACHRGNDEVRAVRSLRGSVVVERLAFKLEQRFSKRRILEMYLDSIYYGHGYWGARQAGLGYFGVRPASLSRGQASLLAGLPQAPTLLDPAEHYAAARRRQREVLGQLVANHLLSAAAARTAFARTGPVRPAS